MKVVLTPANGATIRVVHEAGPDSPVVRVELTPVFHSQDGVVEIVQGVSLSDYNDRTIELFGLTVSGKTGELKKLSKTAQGVKSRVDRNPAEKDEAPEKGDAAE